MYYSLFTSTLLALIASRVAAITCYQGTQNSLQKSDIQQIINDLDGCPNCYNSSPPGWWYFPSGDITEDQTLTVGSAELIVHPRSTIIHSTHVSFVSIAQAAEEIGNQCCGPYSQCIGGTTTIKGDQGSTVDITLTWAGNF